MTAAWKETMLIERTRRDAHARCEHCGAPENWEALAKWLKACAHDDDLDALADSLGVEIESLKRLDCGWSEYHKAFTFPMRIPGERYIGECVGIRLRFITGEKKAITHSRHGLFIPRGLTGSDPLIITEGPTDCASMLDLGFDAIGRPAAFGCEDYCKDMATGRDTVVVADRDEAGVRGAQRTAEHIYRSVKSLKMIRAPWVKDARAWRRAGATRNTVLELIAATPLWRAPRVTS